MEIYSFAAITPKYDVLAEYTDQPASPQKGDMLLINRHPYKIVRWVHDYAEGRCGFAVMVVRDIEYDPYTEDEVRSRLESGETFWMDGQTTLLSRMHRRKDGTLVCQKFNTENGAIGETEDTLDYVCQWIMECSSEYKCACFSADREHKASAKAREGEKKLEETSN